MSAETEQPATRERLVAAMADALQRRGFHGVGLAELLAEARAPKGVLYHHFPGGKTELAIAAIRASVDRVLARLDAVIAAGSDPVEALRAWMSGAQKALAASAFERGCPLATVALESTAADDGIRTALAEGFAAIRERLAQLFAGSGIAPAKARHLSTLIVAAYEGALMQARVAGGNQPMHDTASAIVELVRHELEQRSASK